MPLTLFDDERNTINTILLCNASREYLKKKCTLPDKENLPEVLAWKDILNNAHDTTSDDNEPKRKHGILKNLGEFEQDYEKQHAEKSAKTKRLFLWTTGVFLTTLILLTAATLLVLFPPTAAIASVAAVIMSFFATLGTWSPLLLLTAALPSLGLLVPTLAALKTERKSETQLNKSNALVNEIHAAINKQPQTEVTSSSQFTAPVEDSKANSPQMRRVRSQSAIETNTGLTLYQKKAESSRSNQETEEDAFNPPGFYPKAH